MTPKTFAPSMINPWDYRLAQPYVWARYFAEFFLPLHLNVDTDLTPFSTLNPQALLGLVFLAALLAGIWFTARRRVLYPVAFGLLWFVVTQLPTSLYPLSEVENDHRMFFSFAGLMLAAVWAAWLLLEQMELPEKLRPLLVAAAVLVLAAYGYGAHVRNAVWRTEDTLWADDAVKSPHNGRGLMIYGLTQMNHGDFVKALQTFTQALLYTPNYATLEINLGVVKGILADQGNLALGGDAERHFQRAVALSPGDDAPYAYYGRWLGQHQRFPEAIAQLQLAIALDPVRPFNHDVLIDTETRAGDVEGTKRAAIATLKLIPDDGPALTALAHPEGIIPGQGAAYWINLSLTQSRQGLNEAAIASAKRALAIDPNDADAYVNIGAGYGAMGQWDLAIENETQALRLKPDFQLAKNNIAWYAQQKAAGKAAATGTGSVDALINQSMQLSQAGQYEAGIAAAQKALRIDPGAAIAWNNIAAANEALHRWDKAIDAAQKAIALRPDFQLARNNLAWSVAQKKAGVK
jgi:tetratricopeptide (TPR) repeat protein